MVDWYKKHGKLLYKVSSAAYSLYEVYKCENGIYNGEPRLAHELSISPRTLKRTNVILEDFDLISIDEYTGMCKVNEYPKTNVSVICEKYNVTCEASRRIEDMFDANVLAEIRKKLGNKRIRVEKIGQELGLNKVDVERIKNDKVLSKKYKDALEESLYLFKGTSKQEDFMERLEEWKNNDKWSALVVVGYFCFKYGLSNGTPYLFANAKNPFKSKETRFAAQLVATFREKEVLKDYLDWIFDVKCNSSFNVFGINVLTHGWLINEYNCSKRKKKKITRTTPLPQDYKDWCKNNIPALFEDYELETYGNLKTLLGMVNSNYAEDLVIRAITKAKEEGIIKEKRDAS